VSVEEE